MTYPMDRKTFNLIMGEIFYFDNHKGLFYYASGKSKVLKKIIDIARKSKIPAEYQIAVAVKIVDRKANGACPSWVDCFLRKHPICEPLASIWFSKINSKNIYKAYLRMHHDSLWRYNFCIEAIDRINLGKLY